MRGCVAAVVFSIFLAPAAIPQCNFVATSSAEFRASFLDLAIDGNDLWAATSYGVRLYDRSSDPPQLLSSIPLPDVTRVVRVIGGIAYAGSGSRIYSLKKSGRSIAVTGFVDAGATVNDIDGTVLDLYVATANGLQQYELLAGQPPQRTSAQFITSKPVVFSVAVNGSTLYAADGDGTVEQFSIEIASLPQGTGSISTLPTATSVAVTGQRLYVSDGQRTDLFFISGTSATHVATLNIPSTSVATLTNDIGFFAGNDRRIHGVDWTTAGTPVELFAADAAGTGGTINRITSMKLTGNRLYVAAGDGGLLTWDVSTFAAPFPVRSYTTSPSSSVVWADGNLYASRTAGGISEMKRGSAGNLTAGRQWDNRVQTLLDSGTQTLLSSAGASLLFWALSPQVPVLISSVNFRTNVVSAALIGSIAYAVLSDGSVWTADMSQQTPQAQATTLTASAIARSGSSLGLMSIDENAGTTLVRYFSSGDLTQQPASATVQGASTSGVALSGSTAAVFTFKGISLMNFSSGRIDTVPQSTGAIASSLAFSGNVIAELTDDALVTWDASTLKLIRSTPLPQGGNDLSVDTMAGIATSIGVTTVALTGGTSLPNLIATRNTNVYYKKAAATASRLYLFDGHSIDVFTTIGAVPHYVESIQPPGIIDFAASSSGVYALVQLAASSTVTRYTPDGFLLAQKAVDEGPNVVPVAIATAGDGVWVSISRNCQTAACDKKTVIYDALTLARTSILDGAAVDVTTAANVAYAIFDLPSEVRAYDITDARHPALLASRAAEGSRTPVAIATSNGSVYVLGDNVTIYDGALQKTGQQLDVFPSNAAGFLDQRIFASGNCALVSRGSAQAFALPGWSGRALELPAAVRSITSGPGRIYVLTDDSIELLMTEPPASVKHRSVR